MIETVRDTVGYETLMKQNSWISVQTIELIKEKRTMKHKDQAKYKTLKAEVQKKLQQDKQMQVDDLFNELEIANTKRQYKKAFPNSKATYKKISIES